MRPRGILLATLSSIIAVLAAFVVYASRVQATDEPVWLSSWAIEHRRRFTVILLGLTILSTIIEWLRTFTSSSSAQKQVLQRLINEFSKSHFGDEARKHRLTLFRVASGWKVKLFTFYRFPWWPLDKHKAKAWWRIDLRERYLYVYLRCEGVRNQKSSAAFLIHDTSHRCEGIAGRVWDEGSFQIADLPKFSSGDLRTITTSQDVQQHTRAADIEKYMRETNIVDPKLLTSLQHYAQHFYGIVVKGNTNVPWGVLLLDSESDRCPFTTKRTGQFQKDFLSFAVTLGKILT